MHLIATFTKATIVAFVFLPILLFSQIQIGEDIALDIFYNGFIMASDGSTLLIHDGNDIRLYILNQDKWIEKEAIKNRRWLRIGFSKNGKTFIGTELVDAVTKETGLFSFEFKDDKWVSMPNLSYTVFPIKSALYGHEINVSSDGKKIALINYSENYESFLSIWKFENMKWILEFEEVINDCYYPTAKFDDLGLTLLFTANSSRNKKQFSKVYRYNSGWKDSKWGKFEYDSYGHIQLDTDGSKLNCIFNLNPIDTINSKVHIDIYDITKDNITKSFSQELLQWYSYVSDFSRDGNCFVTGYEPKYNYDTVRVFLREENFTPLNISLISKYADEYYGRNVQVTDDCKVVALSISGVTYPYNRPARVQVFDLSKSSSVIPEIHGCNIVKLYPNPTSSIVKISDLELPSIVQISNLNGQMIKQLNNVVQEINISDMPSGMYIIDIRNKEMSERHKIVKVE